MSNTAWRDSIVQDVTNRLDELKNPVARQIVERGIQEVSSNSDASALYEVFNLLKSSKNAERLLAAIEEARNGNIKPQSPDDLRKEFGLLRAND